jgi:glycosyltransferase involved in cell wall biosynthesis
VKCWERLAEAAARSVTPIDLTVVFEGAHAGREDLAAHVRYRFLRPVLSTRLLGMVLRDIPDHTDLAPHHRALAQELSQVDVIHTTDAYFAYARTGARVARRAGKALVTSLHTDTPGYTAIYAERTFRRLGALGAMLVEHARLPELLAERQRRQLEIHARTAAHVLVSDGSDLQAAQARFGPHVSRLRRGVDRAQFGPAKRDRAWLERRYGIASDRIVLLFAGRLSAGKAAMTLAHAVAALIAWNLPVHVIFAGDGNDRAAIAALLGPCATLAGHLPQDELAVLYASSDLFVFPSPLEIAPNVVVEAKASGLPVVVAPSGGGIFVRDPGADGIVVGTPSPGAWAEAIAALACDASQRAALANAGLHDVAAHHPSWDDVFHEDVMPVWRRAASLTGL